MNLFLEDGPGLHWEGDKRSKQRSSAFIDPVNLPQQITQLIPNTFVIWTIVDTKSVLRRQFLLISL